MSVKYKIRDQDAAYFITFAVVEWVDVFTRREYKDILIGSLKFCVENKGLRVHGYCIMTNHVHLIISRKGELKLEEILRDFKKYTSSQLLRAIENNERESRRNWMLWIFKAAGKKNSNNVNYQFWIQDNHPIELFNKELMQQKLEYIHNNPVKEGIVENPEEYLFSSAKNYSGGLGLMEIENINE